MAKFAFDASQEHQLDATIFGERVYVLYGNAALGQAVNIVIAFAIGVLAWGKIDPVLILSWVGAALVIALARIALTIAFRRAAPGVEDMRLWYWRFFAGVVVTALQWGAAGVLFFVPGDPASQTVLLMILAGLTAGAVPVLAAAQEIYFAYCAVTLLPLGVMLGLQESLAMQVVAVLDVVFIIAMMVVAHHFHTSLANALRLGFENEALAQQILADKGRTESINVGLQGEVSARRRAQDELLKAKETAEAAVRAQGRMLANMSHELREPLHGIISLSHLALTENLSRNVGAYIARILALARSLSGTLNGILDITDIESGTLAIERTPFRLSDVLENVSAVFGTLAAEKGLSLSVYADPGLPRYVIGDAARIGQIVNNFVSNAIKFTDRGSIAVDARVKSFAGNRATVSFSVLDTGAGLTEQQKLTAFDTPNRTGPGTGGQPPAIGIGLALCRQLATAMGGRIGVESEPKKGARFWVDLPLEMPEDAGTPEMGEEGEEAADLQGLNVLIADNDRVNQLVIRTLLERRGVNVVATNDGREALNIALDRVTPLDVVLIDLDVPLVDARAFARAVRKKIPAGVLPIVGMTDQPVPIESKECRELGMHGCLSKPLSPRDLFRAVHSAVRVRAQAMAADPARGGDASA